MAACRGLRIDPGVETDGGEETLQDQQFLQEVSATLPTSPAPTRDPTHEDMFVSYATIPAYVAYRNNVKGSWFVQCFCKGWR